MLDLMRCVAVKGSARGMTTFSGVDGAAVVCRALSCSWGMLRPEDNIYTADITTTVRSEQIEL